MYCEMLKYILVCCHVENIEKHCFKLYIKNLIFHSVQTKCCVPVSKYQLSWSEGMPYSRKCDTVYATLQFLW